MTTGVGAALNAAKVTSGSTVAVIGCGGVGLNCVQGAKIAGALRIIAVDTVGTKLGLAQEFGATDVIDTSSGDVVEKIKAITDGGMGYSFGAIGRKETAEQAFYILRPSGTATLIGMIPQGPKIEIERSDWSERRTQDSRIGSNRFRVDMPRYLELYLQGRLMLDELVSQCMKLEQVNEAFEDVKGGHMARSVLVFD